ncbi:glutamate-1-semialdehyde aminotransferase [Striga asiatica]|uniref:Glutamate-1-semialdehyde aminotransferase n=1 Tax=Striga asiatica TaxID=4170 RepID=A0A5A7Q641_STRAF|nr:glutamate-1-semialdehyde aminotransferase [Striga asiatica]
MNLLWRRTAGTTELVSACGGADVCGRRSCRLWVSGSPSVFNIFPPPQPPAIFRHLRPATPPPCLSSHYCGVLFKSGKAKKLSTSGDTSRRSFKFIYHCYHRHVAATVSPPPCMSHKLPTLLSIPTARGSSPPPATPIGQPSAV